MDELQKYLADIREGDRAAFEALYECMKKPLYTIIWRITQDKALSEDILQDMFLKIYLTAPEPSANPRAYLCQMARNLAIDSVRKRKPDVDLDKAENSLYDQADIPQRLDVENAIKALPQQDQQIVTLHINGGLKFREVAAIVGIPLGTVLWSYQKAIKQLRITLGGTI